MKDTDWYRMWQVADDRAKALRADKAKLVEAIGKIVAWYDGECLFEETNEIFESTRAVLKKLS